MIKILIEIIKMFMSNSKTIDKEAEKVVENKKEEEVVSDNKEEWKITIKEFLRGRIDEKDMDPAHHANMISLLTKMNKVRERYGKPMKTNDGYRRPQDRPKNGSATSWHYQGAAIDIDDNDAGDFAKWCLEPENLEFIASLDLYLEDPRWTNGCGSWVHFQDKAPKSGKRVFVPSSQPPCNPDLWDGKYDPKLDKK